MVPPAAFDARKVRRRCPSHRAAKYSSESQLAQAPGTCCRARLDRRRLAVREGAGRHEAPPDEEAGVDLRSRRPAIFGALFWQAWEPPERESRADLVVGRDVVRIAATLDAIHQDLVCPENEPVSESLAPLASERHGKKPTRIELFDMVWWRYFGDREPAPGRRAAVGASGT